MSNDQVAAKQADRPLLQERPDFDHRDDPGLLHEPWDRWNELRAESRIAVRPYEDYKIWILADYDDVRESLQRYDLFTSKNLNVYGPMKEPDLRIIPAEIDPPDQAAYRQMILSYLSPKRVTEMTPHIRERAVELIEGLAGKGRCDLMKDFSKKFPTYIFMELFGLPTEDLDQVSQWADTNLHAGSDPESQAVAQAAMAEIHDYLRALARKRRAEPADDLMSCLVTSDFNGRKLSDAEIIGYSVTLYLGGLDTVASEFGFMFHFLAQNPDHRRQLVETPAIIPNAVEEFLRYFSIITLGRTVAQDVEFKGCPMRAGDRVMISTVAAGRDEREFADAEKVDFNRKLNRHLAFGAGPHRCIGSHLARAELIIGLEEWHKRIPEYRLSAGDIHRHGGVVLGLGHLPLEWDTMQ